MMSGRTENEKAAPGERRLGGGEGNAAGGRFYRVPSAARRRVSSD